MDEPRVIYVLGASSFSGQDLVDLLLEETDARIVGVGRSAHRTPMFLRYLARRNDALSRYRYDQIDLNRDMEQLLAALDRDRPQAIVNFAAQSEVAPSWTHPEHWFQTNTVALAELVNHLRRSNYLERYIHISSPEVYGTCEGVVREDAPLNPSTPYAASKAAADMLLETYRRQFGLPVLWVRSTNVYGARQQLFKIIPRSAIYLCLPRTIKLHGGGTAVKSYIHVRDVSRGELAILRRGRVGEVYHLSPEEGVAVRDVVRLMCEHARVSFENATKTVAERLGQDAAYVIDSTKARSELNWSPRIGLAQGLDEVIGWVHEYWGDILQLPLEYVHRP